MTDFAQIKLIYKQFLNLSKEIDGAIKEENYELASTKTGQREALINQMFAAYKTANLTNEERKMLDDINSKIQEKYKQTIDNLQQTKGNILKEIKKTKTQSKIVNAYEYQEKDASNGTHVDIEE